LDRTWSCGTFPESGRRRSTSAEMRGAAVIMPGSLRYRDPPSSRYSAKHR
jgi:hypothetical protein